MPLTETLTFSEPRAEDALWAEPMLRALGSPLCEYNFATIYMWRHYYRHRIARIEERVLVESRFKGELSFLYPMGQNRFEDIERLADYAHSEGAPLVLYGADAIAAQELAAHYPHRFDIAADRDDADYIYRREALATLSGKAYQKKRNHIAAFTRDFPWSYEPLDDENLADALSMAEQWYREAEPLSASLAAERAALPELLQQRELLRLRGALLRVEGAPVALTLASAVSRRVADIQIEKALAAYPGAYAVINRQFAQDGLADFDYINRENDMGLDGLRRAKLSYRPVLLGEKYVAVEHR